MEKDIKWQMIQSGVKALHDLCTAQETLQNLLDFLMDEGRKKGDDMETDKKVLECVRCAEREIAERQ